MLWNTIVISEVLNYDFFSQLWNGCLDAINAWRQNASIEWTVSSLSIGNITFHRLFVCLPIAVFEAAYVGELIYAFPAQNPSAVLQISAVKLPHRCALVTGSKLYKVSTLREFKQRSVHWKDKERSRTVALNNLSFTNQSWAITQRL